MLTDTFGKVYDYGVLFYFIPKILSLHRDLHIFPVHHVSCLISHFSLVIIVRSVTKIIHISSMIMMNIKFFQLDL